MGRRSVAGAPGCRGAVRGGRGRGEVLAWGFSPGVAARLRTSDGLRVFVKAIGPEPNPDALAALADLLTPSPLRGSTVGGVEGWSVIAGGHWGSSGAGARPGSTAGRPATSTGSRTWRRGHRRQLILEGSGKVAVTSDGEPVLLDTSTPTFADPDSAVAWSGGVRTSVRSDVSFKTFIGKGSGETFQIGFEGAGWVLIQPSEGPTIPEHFHGGEGGSGGLGSFFED